MGDTMENYKRHLSVYLDNAATSFPKPQGVIDSVCECIEDYGGNAGRSSHFLAIRAAEKIYETREIISSLFNCETDRVIFTLNTTYALNMAIKGVMRGGGHVLISDMEHNSVLRPVEKLKKEGLISYDIFKSYDLQRQLSPNEIVGNILKLIRPDTKMLICLHASNLCPHTLPVAEIGKLCHKKGIVFVVDAAQSAGHIPIDVKQDNIDILCFPAHKGLYGPQGCGVMALGDGVDPDTLIEGGNGISSLELSMGDQPPERYEAGTLCTPAIAGLCAGACFVKELGIENIFRHESRLHARAASNLKSIRGITLYGCRGHGGPLLFNIDGMRSDRVGEMLSDMGFCLRSGYHCSALGHRALMTPDGGGVRMSAGIFNTDREIDLFCQTVEKISRTR